MPIINMVYKKKKWWKPWANTIAYYKFEWDAKDYSWNWHDLTASWNVSYTTLNWRQVVYMQGSSSWNSTKLVTATFTTSANVPATFSIWCRTNANGWSIPNGYQLLIYYLQSSPYYRQWIYTSWGNNRDYKIGTNQNLQSTWVYPDIWDNTFHLVTATFTTSNMKLYIDWTLKYTWTWTSALSYNWKILVWSNDDSYYWFNWYIWDTIIENIAWDDAAIANYYNQTKANYWL